MGQGDLPTSRGGPFRRRRERRQLEELAEASARGVAPRASSAHVRVLDDQSDAWAEDVESREPDSASEEPPQVRVGGFHVRAVPIDQPVGE